ncbi:MAG: flagellar protein FlaG [Undibacterium sp.]|uniref:flagellar protein FlaG n=1 Tax=Undibacterium sp. TaxID=1914977 RepID=UPI0027246CCF|nr:flagellar protein FlaG [Undibacterium sp.]MDO8651596.1 flagellar protein FlaG [Undibacterium sp.]
MDILSVGNQLSSGSPASDRVIVGSNGPQNIKTAAPVQSYNPVTPSGQAQQTATKEEVSKAVESINKTIQSSAQNVEFSIDSDSHEVIVKVIDQQTKQVLRQIPTLEVLEIAKSLDKLQGLLIKQTA